MDLGREEDLEENCVGLNKVVLKRSFYTLRITCTSVMNDFFDSSLFFTLTGFLQDIDQTLDCPSSREVCGLFAENLWRERSVTPTPSGQYLVSLPHQTDIGIWIKQKHLRGKFLPPLP